MHKIILAFRYFLKRRITRFAVLAVALCVLIVFVVMTIMTGLVNDFKRKNHDFVGDCVVGTESLVGFSYYEEFVDILEAQNDFIRAISPVIKNYILISVKGSQRNRGLEMMGIDPVKHHCVAGFGKTLYFHRSDVSRAFEPSYDPNLTGCILGIDLQLERNSRGEYLYAANPVNLAFSISCFPLTAKGGLLRAGTTLVSMKTFNYSDVSQSGLAHVDSSIVYLPFEQAQELCGMDRSIKRISAIHIKFKPDVELQAGCEKVNILWRKYKQEKADEAQAYLLDTVKVQSWKDYRRSAIAPMENEQIELSVMFGFVGITNIFIVLVVFYMIISHKSKDIGILKSIGVSNTDIVQLFSCFACLVGILGSGIGLLGGWIILRRIDQIEDFLFKHFDFQFWDKTIYTIGDIPNQVSLKVLIIIIISAIVACLAGALIPSIQAARQKPIETLQVNQL
ncbi:MAG: FtsX-like permease family protein [Sedimentisphaerales bacterium]|nr:FtsX-like permease family protein [Sedimentisphaerales bacterium]